MRLKRKIPSFIFGVSIGLVIGIGIFILKLDEIFERLKDNAREQITVIEQPVKNVKQPDSQGKKDKDRFKIDLLNNSKDPKEADTAETFGADLNVATDELLSVKSVKLIRIGEASLADSSHAMRLAGIEENISNLYFVEFWRTPLNTRGYRFTKNKIMLYGFVDFRNMLLYSLENEFYIKSSDQVYKLSYSGAFMPLEKVIDNEILAKIN